MPTLAGGPVRVPVPTPDNAQIGNAAVADPGAITSATPAAAAAGTAANPGAVTNYPAVVNMTDPVTKAEGEAVSAALALLEDEVTAIRAEVVKLVTDMATRRTEINAVRAELIAANVDIAAVRTKLIALLTALENAAPNPLLPV